MTTVLWIIAFTASRKWPLFQLDINNAFLHGNVHVEVYMKVPDGLDHSPNDVCRLKKVSLRFKTDFSSMVCETHIGINPSRLGMVIGPGPRWTRSGPAPFLRVWV